MSMTKAFHITTSKMMTSVVINESDDEQMDHFQPLNLKFSDIGALTFVFHFLFLPSLSSHRWFIGWCLEGQHSTQNTDRGWGRSCFINNHFVHRLTLSMSFDHFDWASNCAFHKTPAPASIMILYPIYISIFVVMICSNPDISCHRRGNNDGTPFFCRSHSLGKPNPRRIWDI